MDNRRDTALNVEQLETRDTPALVSVPPALVADPQIVAWQQEHAVLDTVTSRAGLLQNDVSLLTQDLGARQAGTEAARSAWDVVNSQLQGALDQRPPLTQNVQTFQGQETSLRAEQGSALQRVSALQGEITAFQSQLTSFGAQSEQLQTTLAPMLTKMETLQKDLVIVTQELTKRPRDKKLLSKKSSLESSIKILQPQIDGVQAQRTVVSAQITAVNAAKAADEAELARLQDRLNVLPADIAGAQTRRQDAERALSSLDAAVERLRGEVKASRAAYDAVFAAFSETENLLEERQEELGTVWQTLQNETLLVDALDAEVEGLVEMFLAKQQELLSPQAPLVPQATVKESFVRMSMGVEITGDMDWLYLRTKYFSGTASFTLGSATITPEAGDRVIKVPRWVVPETIRGDLPAIQTIVNRQMQSWDMPAAMTATGDLFSHSVIGTWSAEVVTTGGNATPLSFSQLAPIGTLSGVSPDGTQGKEIPRITPRVEIYPDGDTQKQRFTLRNFAEGYVLEYIRPWKNPVTLDIAAGTSVMEIPLDARDWNIRTKAGAYVMGDTYTGQPSAFNLSQIAYAPPAGTRDLPLSVAVNRSDAPAALEGTGNAAPLAGQTLLVHPTTDKDVRVLFTPNGSGTAMLRGSITDLDARVGDGVTVALSIRSADGTMREQWRKAIANGGALSNFDNLPLDQRLFGLAAGDSIVLTITSGADDLCDSIQVDLKAAFVPTSVPRQGEYGMGNVNPALQNLLATGIIEKLNLFDRGPGVVTINSSSTDIARWQMGSAAYDQLSPQGQSDLRNAIEVAKGRMWDAYLVAVQDTWNTVLMEMNGVVLPRNTSPIKDPTGHNAQASIPNLPSRDEIYRMCKARCEEIYEQEYERICADSIAVFNAEHAASVRSQEQDQALHDALAAAGLLHVQNIPIAQRTTEQQLALDKVFVAVAGAPDRAGWTVAEFTKFSGAVVAASKVEPPKEFVTQEGTAIAYRNSMGEGLILQRNSDGTFTLRQSAYLVATAGGIPPSTFNPITLIARDLSEVSKWISAKMQGTEQLVTGVSSSFTSFFNSLKPALQVGVQKVVERAANTSGIPRNWDDLTDAQKKIAQEVLSIDNFNELPETNQKILTYVMNSIIPTLKYQNNGTYPFIGELHGTGLEQCKTWIQNWLQSSGITLNKLPTNKTSDIKGIGSYEWNSFSSTTANVTVVASIRGDKTFEEMINNSSDVKVGDVVQMGYGSIPHTMLITKIQSDGLWVLDTNFGNNENWMEIKDFPGDINTHLEITRGVIDEFTHSPRELTAEEKNAGIQPTLWKQPDNTPRYHFMSFNSLNLKATYTTIYRIES